MTREFDFLANRYQSSKPGGGWRPLSVRYSRPASGRECDSDAFNFVKRSSARRISSSMTWFASVMEDDIGLSDPGSL